MVIAEDSTILRDGLVQLLTDRGFVVLRAVSDAIALEQAVDGDVPDVAVVDIRMPPTFTDEGLRSAIGLRRDHPEVGILVFSQYIETRCAAELLAGGAAGRVRLVESKDQLDRGPVAPSDAAAATPWLSSTEHDLVGDCLLCRDRWREQRRQPEVVGEP